ncbi:MAG TPA: hypothetical protein VHP30_10670 [Ignavibacteriales bacterium]|nr:hypothetical protein [Ignavibacteriales bacterium]
MILGHSIERVVNIKYYFSFPPIYNSVIGKQKKKSSVKNSGAKKIRIGYISTEPDAFAVPYLRLRSPLNALQDKGLVKIIELGDFANRKSYSLNKNKLQDKRSNPVIG